MATDMRPGRTVPTRVQDTIILVARVLLAALFIVFGWDKCMDVAGTVGYMQHLGVPAAQPAAYAAIVIELGIGVLLIVGAWTRPAAYCLAAYALAAGVIGHPFWTAEDAQRYADATQFYKNLCICGGCLLLAVAGPGRFSVDARWRVG